ncbi:hypothetical protein [Phaffia rhodozyma]|uniref:DUF4048 domain-containing protein n=1 Tax=Phaffia rhodozyma TaxID=264483 RepID=A0A0F7SJ40_PHARH|nr:hypothetical protein [Phaffia rhodozyma]
MDRPPSSTPRRTHLKTLSLAQVPSVNTAARSFSGPPASASCTPPNMKTTLAETFSGDPPGTPSSRQTALASADSLPGTPATPGTPSGRVLASSLSRAGSVGRNPMRRKPSISYSPSFRENLSTDSLEGAVPKGRASPMLGTPRSTSMFGLGISEEEPLDGAAQSGEQVGLTEGVRSISIGRSPRRTRRSMEDMTAPATSPAPAAQAMTLAEKHADLLSFIAQKESRCLELREQLAQNEAELANLKKKWTTVVSRASARSANELNPPFSANQNRTNNAGNGQGSGGNLSSVASLGAHPEGLLSSETIQSGKRLLNLVLGVDLDEPSSVSPSSESTPLPTPPPSASLASVPNSSSTSSSSSSSSPSPFSSLTSSSSSSSTSNSAPVRHKYTSSSLSSSSLEKVSEAPEDPLSASLLTKPESNGSPMSNPRPVPPSRPASHSTRRLSLLSQSSGSSIDSTVQTFSQSSVDLMMGNSWDPDLVLSEEGEEEAGRRERGSARGLMEGLAASSGVSTSGWGKKFGELAQGLSGNEHFLQSKRATLSFTSSLSSAFSFSPLGGGPSGPNPSSQSSDPDLSTSPTPVSSLSKPSPLTLSRSTFSSSPSSKLKATKMRPLSRSNGLAQSPGFGRALTSPTGVPRDSSDSIDGADFFGPDASVESNSLQTPLEPVGRVVSRGDENRSAEGETRTENPLMESEGDWNW